MKRAYVLGLMVLAVLASAAAWWLGLLNAAGIGTTPTLRRAARRADALPQVVTLEGLGLVARVNADTRCAPGFGARCNDDRSRIAWSICPVDAPTETWARTSTCAPDDFEEGISSWSQERVGRVAIAGFDGFIVSWSPVGRAKRGDGCSFRGYRKDDTRGWLLLQIEATPACNDDLLAMMLSTRK